MPFAAGLKPLGYKRRWVPGRWMKEACCWTNFQEAVRELY
jgi:hypothetical protein